MAGTTKSVDFHQAAKRHFTDAELLMKHGRQSNAGHLYGFVAECGIKCLLVWKGYPTNPDMGEIVEKQRKFRTHIHELVNNINMIHAFLDGRGAAKYLTMIPSIGHFSNWKTDHRYYVDSALPSSITDWGNASQEVMRMLDQAMLDGVIT